MSINETQLQGLIIRVLKEAGLYSPEAVNLLMGTAAQESALGLFISQIRGPAKGIFQCEPATEKDIWENFLKYRDSIRRSIWIITEHKGWGPWLEWDLAYQILICRCHYLRCPGAIPKTVEDQAWYWKKFYNTVAGAGTVQQYIENYRRYCGG